MLDSTPSDCKASVIFSLEILSLYWNSLPFRGGSIDSLSIRCTRIVDRVSVRKRWALHRLKLAASVADAWVWV